MNIVEGIVGEIPAGLCVLDFKAYVRRRPTRLDCGEMFAVQIIDLSWWISAKSIAQCQVVPVPMSGTGSGVLIGAKYSLPPKRLLYT